MNLFVASLTMLAGLVLVYRGVRDLAGSLVAAWTTVGLFLGTGLLRALSQDADPTSTAMGFALASVALALWWPIGSGDRSLRALLGNFAALMAVAIPYARTGIVALPEPWRLEERLFGSPRGLLFESPFLWTGVVGLVMLARREWRAVAKPAAVAALVLVVSTTTPASAAEAPFGAALPALALGTGAFLSWLRRVVGTRPGLPIMTAGALLTLWNALFMEQYRTDRIPRDLPVSFSQITETNAEILSRAVGSPPAWPANWFFAWRHHVTPAKFDVVVGRSLLGKDPRRTFSIDDPQVDPSLLAEGWGARTSWEGVACRRLAGSARLFLPFGGAGPLGFTIRAAGSGALSVEINSSAVAKVDLESGFRVYDVPAAGGLWRHGVNEVRLTYAGPGEAQIAGFGFGAEERR